MNNWKLYLLHTSSKLLRPMLNDFNSIRVITFHGFAKNKIIKYKDSFNYFEFESFIKFLKDNNYQTINLSSLLSTKRTNYKTIALTFDDGLFSSYKVAFEVLCKYSFTASFFITTSFIHDRIKPVNQINGIGSTNDYFMSMSHIKELNDNGFEIGSHSHNHIKLAKYNKQTIYKELYTSKEILEEIIGSEVISFAYPYGMPESFSNITKQILKKTGYQIGCTQIGGKFSIKTNLLQIPRTAISNSDRLKDMIKKTQGEYDFMKYINQSWFRKYFLNKK